MTPLWKLGEICFRHQHYNMCLTSTLVVTSHESNACSVFALQVCLCAIRVRMNPLCDQLNPKIADMEKAMDVTTEVLVKPEITLKL